MPKHVLYYAKKRPKVSFSIQEIYCGCQKVPSSSAKTAASDDDGAMPFVSFALSLSLSLSLGLAARNGRQIRSDQISVD